MIWIKGTMRIEADGAFHMLKSLGYKTENELLAAEKRAEKIHKLKAWLAKEQCPECKRLRKRCICEKEVNRDLVSVCNSNE